MAFVLLACCCTIDAILVLWGRNSAGSGSIIRVGLQIVLSVYLDRCALADLLQRRLRDAYVLCGRIIDVQALRGGPNRAIGAPSSAAAPSQGGCMGRHYRQLYCNQSGSRDKVKGLNANLACSSEARRGYMAGCWQNQAALTIKI